MKRLVLMVCIFAAFAILTIGCASGSADNRPVKADLVNQPTQSAVPIAVVEATSTSIVQKPSDSRAIFNTGEVVYKEHSSAKGKIGIETTKPAFRSDGYRYFQGSIYNISQEILDATLFIEWKSLQGQTIKKEEFRESRFLPGQTAFWKNQVQFPSEASILEFSIEVKAPSRIPPSVSVNFIDDPTAGGKIRFEGYDSVVEKKGTPLEFWKVSSKLRNVSSNERLTIEISFVIGTATKQESAILVPRELYQKEFDFPYDINQGTLRYKLVKSEKVMPDWPTVSLEYSGIAVAESMKKEGISFSVESQELLLVKNPLKMDVASNYGFNIVNNTWKTWDNLDASLSDSMSQKNLRDFLHNGKIQWAAILLIKPLNFSYGSGGKGIPIRIFAEFDRGTGQVGMITHRWPLGGGDPITRRVSGSEFIWEIPRQDYIYVFYPFEAAKTKLSLEVLPRR